MLVLMIEKLLGPHDKYTNRLRHHIDGINKKRAFHVLFIAAVIFAMFFSEFVLAFSTPHQPLRAYAYFLDNSSGGNAVANALGKLTITEEAHLLIKGSGRYTIKIVDSRGRVLFSKAGIFNKTGYAEVVFTLSPSKFRVGESYYAYITAEDNPFPLFYRYAETKISFKIHKDYPVIGLGAVRDGNQTLITARILTGAGPLRNKKIWFAYKRYNENETLRTLGCALSDNDGRAVFVTNALNESRMYLIVAEFYGDNMYMPTATSQAYLPVITAEDYSRHDALMNVLNTTVENSHGPEIQVEKKATVKYGKTGRAVLSSTSYKVAMTADERFRKVTASDRIKSNANSDYKFKFTDVDLVSLSLVEFLKRITTEDTPASALINIANILMNLDNVPFVLEQTQELLSKLQVPLIPDVAHSSMTEIRLYRTKTYVVNVEKTVAEKHVETYTVTKKVSKKVKYTETITKKIKVRVQYIYYQKIVRKEMAFIRRPRPHWQIVYVTTYKPVVKWKYVWKTVKQTVTRYKTVTYTVTEKKTRTYYTYKTVTEKVKKEKREYFRILITEGFTVINEQTNEKMSLQQFFLFIMGFREDALGQIIRYLEAKIFGPAMNILNQLIEFLISVTKRFLTALIENLFERLRNLLIQGLMVHTIKYSSNRDANTEASEQIKQDGDLLWKAPTDGKKPQLEPADRYFNMWDSLHKIQPGRRRDLAESTRLTIAVRSIEASVEQYVTGEDAVVVVPATTEVLVATRNENKELVLGWRDMNKYDHTVYMDDLMSADVEMNNEVGRRGEIPLGISRSVYIMIVPDKESLTGRKLVIAYSINVASDDAKLVPDALKKFVEITEGQNDYTKSLKESFDRQYYELKRSLGVEDEINTYGELREVVASKYNLSPEEFNAKLEEALDYTRMSGIEVASVESGGTTTQFFVFKKEVTYTDSKGETKTYYPWKINSEESLREWGNRNRYDESLSVAYGLLGREFFEEYKKQNNIPDGKPYINEALEKRGLDFNIGEKVATPLFKRVCEIAEKNGVSAGGILYVLIPSLIDEADGIKVIGESDEFHNARKAMTIIEPAFDNSFAVMFLDYFRAYEKHMYDDIRDSISRNHKFKTSQLKIFQKSVIDAYRLAIIFNTDPERIKFTVKYKDEKGELRSTELSLNFLMEHAEDIGVIRGSNKLKMIEISGDSVPVDRIMEGFMRIKIEQKGNRVTIYPLDENLEPISGAETTFSIDQTGDMKYLKLSNRNEIYKRQMNGISEVFFAAEKIVYSTMYACFKEMIRKNPELDAKFGNLLADVELLGQDPHESAGFLIFLLIQDTKGSAKIYTLVKRYLLTMARDEKILRETLNKMKEIVNNEEMISKLGLTDKDVSRINEVIEMLENEIEHLKDPANPKFTPKEKDEKDKDNGKRKLNAVPRSFQGAYNHRERIRTILDILRVYIERLLGDQESIKRLCKDTAVGVLVGLMYPTVADAIMTLDLSFIEELLDRNPKAFFALFSDKKVQVAVGLSLSVISFALLNLDLNRFLKKHAESQNARHNTAVLKELFGQLFDLKMITATVLSGFGMLLKSLVESPFYTTEEIEEEISRQVHEKLGDVAGTVWDVTAGYKIPGLDMSVFEFALTLVLQGNGGIFQLIIMALTKAVEYLLSKIIEPVAEPLIAEYAYLLADTVLE